MSLYAVGVDLGTMQAAGAVPTLVRKTVTFVAGTTGAVNTHDLFTVTGDVIIEQYGIKCTTSLTVGGSTTLTVGRTGSAARFFNGTSGPLDLTTWDAGMWADTSGGVAASGTAAAMENDLSPELLSGNITYTIGTSTITGGVLVFYFLYRPLSAGASVVAA